MLKLKLEEAREIKSDYDVPELDNNFSYQHDVVEGKNAPHYRN